MTDGDQPLDEILTWYQRSFVEKVYCDENDDHDLLMDVFSLLPVIKRENRQYWGRELGMCWQLLVTRVFQTAPAVKHAPITGQSF